jgi:hypothetical protein
VSGLAFGKKEVSAKTELQAYCFDRLGMSGITPQDYHNWPRQNYPCRAFIALAAL